MEKLSRGNIVTLVLAGGFVLVVVVVAVLMSGSPSVSTSTVTSAVSNGEAPVAGTVSPPPASGTESAPAGGAMVQAPVSAITDQGNSFCRSYVFKRCNELGLVPSECASIAETGAGIPRQLGVAGCRDGVDPLLNKAAGLPEPDQEQEEGAAAEGEPPAEEDDNVESPVAPTDQPAPEPAAAGGAKEGGSATVDPDVASRRMERMRQLETEINVARNTYVGTNIGVQSRLDEMRAIAEELDTPEAKANYNSMLQRLGRSDGQGPVPPSGEVVPSAVVEAAPSSF